MRLISASPADAEDIARLASDIWRKVYPSIISEGQIEHMLQRMYAPELIRAEIEERSVRYFFLEIEGNPEGFSAYSVHYKGPIAQGPPLSSTRNTAMLQKLYLHPRRHGTGLGTRMLQLVELNISAELPSARRIILRVNRQNDKAIKAYQRNAYQIAGTVCSDIGGGYVMDDYWMVKDLPIREAP
jgi:GNAT superfamily N-acetyltransferase